MLGAEMGVPAEIRAMKPGTGYEVKEKGGRYYVYEVRAKKLASGAWGKRSGRCVGKVVPGEGFVPNANWEGEGAVDESPTCLEYGQYALVEAVAAEELALLKGSFPADVATKLFCMAVLMYADGFRHADQVGPVFEQSWMPLEHAAFGLRMGRTSVGSLLDGLGRRAGPVVAYEQALVDACREMAVDGHAIASHSSENDLAEAGYKFRALGDDQVNLPMGYDTASGSPVFSHMYRGSAHDAADLAEASRDLDIHDLLLLADRGFYSEENMRLFSSSGNSYIMPVPSNRRAFKDAMAELWSKGFSRDFQWRGGRKHSRVQWRQTRLEGGDRVIVFRDVEENERCRFNYQRCIDLGRAGYTAEGLEEQKETFGVYVLRTSSKLAAPEVFSAYKRRWGIETLYQYVANVGGFENLKVEDYYKEQGMAFVMLVCGRIHARVIAAVRSLGDSTTSVRDVLLMARRLKLVRRGGSWELANARRKDLDLLARLGFEPVRRIDAA